MARPLLEVDGLRELRSTLRRLDGQVGDKLKDLNQQAGEIVAGEARRRAPKRTGALAGSIRPARQQGAVVVRAGSARIPYAQPIHWGWPRRHIRPSLFLTGAVAAKQADVLRVYTAGLARIVNRYN